MTSRKVKFILLLLAWIGFRANAQTHADTIVINKDLMVVRLTDHSFVHISLVDSKEWGKFPSNGIIYCNNGKAVMMDTPMEPSLTKDLVKWIKNDLKADLIAFVPNHWHQDCLGGFGYLDTLGIKSYAQQKTIEIADSILRPAPKVAFKDSLVLPVGDEKIVFRYFGPGHAIDNVVAWIPSEKVLFAGCMVKELSSKTLGNTADADVVKWPETLKLVLGHYEDAKYVIPGHGAVGGTELINHTIDLLNKK